MKILPWIITCILILFIIYHYIPSKNTPRPIEAEIEHYYLKGLTEKWLGNEFSYFTETTLHKSIHYTT